MEISTLNSNLQCFVYEIENFYAFMVQIDRRKKENLGSWFSDASQPFNKYSHHSSVVKVSCI